MSAASLARTTFKTSPLLDFCSEKELIAQTGHRPVRWPLLVLKELVRRMHKQAVIQDKIDDLIEELDEFEVEVPANLRQRTEKAIKADPSQSWDAALDILLGDGK
jgi:hypothetical protein